jgi:prophage regulatory protein
MLERILRRPEVEACTGLPKSSIYALMADNKFPKPVPIRGSAVGWLESEIETWQKKRIAERDKPAAPQPKRRRASNRKS